MDTGSLLGYAVSIAIAIIGGAFAWSAKRAATRASVTNNNSTLEAQRLEQAYERARKFDIETIERQDKEIKELHDDVERLTLRVRYLEGQLGLSDRKDKI